MDNRDPRYFYYFFGLIKSSKEPKRLGILWIRFSNFIHHKKWVIYYWLKNKNKKKFGRWFSNPDWDEYLRKGPYLPPENHDG